MTGKIYFSKYSEERFTRDLRVPYFVKSDFMSNYRNKLQQVEHQVEDEYISQLRMNCYKERSQSESFYNFSIAKLSTNMPLCSAQFILLFFNEYLP